MTRTEPVTWEQLELFVIETDEEQDDEESTDDDAAE